MHRASIAVVAIALLALGGAMRGAEPTRVLFVGNSLTTVNDLPGLVGRLAAASNVAFASRTVAFPNYSLEDHWNRGDARRAIAAGGWSFVVLQQGPSALPASRTLLVAYTKRFDEEARRVGARTALYMVWPSTERRIDFEGVRLSYATAAREVGGVLIPAGEAWRQAWRRDARLELYGPDGFHPTPAGSYLAALTAYQALFARSPIELPALDLPAGQARMLQQAAAAAAAR